MSRISESMIDDGFSDPMEYMDQSGKKTNRKPSLMNIYDEDDEDEDNEDEDDEDEEDEDFENEDDDDDDE